ncbi:MAG: polysaccharide biosynthesis protein [Lachnospiraceae bacterium]|nr:polysaccharide biosynthesis protein [Lachnospiraceae bacterium]
MSESNSTKTTGILKQGSILAMTSILVRIIGMVYRIPMANIIGDEGNGVYSTAFEIYNILLIISSYGMPMAVSKMVSAKLAKKRYKEARRVFRCSLLFSVISGGLAALFVFIFAGTLENTLFSAYKGITIPLRILAPTIFVVAVMGVYRGFFQGQGTMIPTALSQVIEQIVNAFVSVYAAYILIIMHSADPKMPAWGAAGGTLGTCLGAVSAFIVLMVIYFLQRKSFKRRVSHDKRPQIQSVKSTYVLIFMTVIPIVLSQTVYQLSGIIDSTIFGKGMEFLGHSHIKIKTLWGIYSTKYRLLVSVPIAVSTAIASSMIPSLVQSIVSRDKKAVVYKVNLSIKFNMIIAIPSAFGLMVLANPILKLLFRNSDYKTGSLMLILGSFCVVFYALSTMTSGVLQSIDKMSLPVYHSLISLVIHVVLVLILLLFTPLGVYAMVIGNVTYPLGVCILNAISVRKYLKIKQETKTTFILPTIASLVMSVCTILAYAIVNKVFPRLIVTVPVALIVAVCSYFVVLLKINTLTKQELFEFPFGRKMYILATKLRIMK